ncbi:MULTISPECIES: hypothetical protein [unclassified Coleofasciculus]|uniref:hypothetical protein n=1 Tax=unclassified Coleofasciculus TaxID=2692782 RepID=UPI00188282DB|nr:MULTISPECIES: hypothetical protein [unclassified Coleofasciculus]MBE9125821.1 hypothetical protein [Coleofasciculus sp. LEGE 07081]MBE9148994.1 hypothetical protein [Coleofasciculus sp. LEGE 07092]
MKLNNCLKKLVDKNKFIAILIIYLIAISIAYFLVLYPIIESIYNGEAIYPLNKFVLESGENTLDFYLKKVDKIFFAFNLLLAFIAITLNLVFRLFRNTKVAFMGFGIFFIFYSIYLVIGILLLKNLTLSKYVFFGADYWEWTLLKWEAYHKGSHPLILLIVVPLGYLINSLIKSTEVSGIILNSFFGALAVLLSSVFFWNLTKKYLETILLSIVFGLSMSQLVFSVVPESYTLAGCSIITTYILFLLSLQRKKLYFQYWIIIGIFSFGVTITNFIQTLICFIGVRYTLTKRKIATNTLSYIAFVIILCFCLTLLQKKLFPLAKYFFLTSTASTQLEYVKTNLLNQPLSVIWELIKHFLLVNFWGSSPFTGVVNLGNSNRLVLGFFQQPLDYSFVGYIGLSMWIALLIIGFYKNFLTGRKSIYIVVLSSAVFYNMVLHSFFGVEEMFLYTCHFTFPVLLLAVNHSVLEKNYIKLGLILLIILMGINNLSCMAQILTN